MKLQGLKAYDKVLRKEKKEIEEKPKVKLPFKQRVELKLKVWIKLFLKPFKLLYNYVVKPLNVLPNGLYFLLFLAFCFVLFAFFIWHEIKVNNAFISNTC